MHRRTFLTSGAALAGAAHADVPAHRWDGHDFGGGPRVTERLNQGPFSIEQDQGWYTIATTSPSERPVRNYGLGLVGYTWEESGPALGVRKGTATLEQQVEKLASLAFVDLLYIRCDWRDVQRSPGRLDLNPVWGLTFDAAQRHGLRVGFRIQLSSPNIQPARLSIPDFLRDKVPLVNIGRRRPGQDFDYYEPRYDHPEFQKAFVGLNELLAAAFDSDPRLEFVDLMMYGFWGEGHTGDLPHPFPDYLTAERTFVQMTQLQLDTWKKAQLAVNTQPDISRVGNNEVLDMAVRAGCWLRSDSILVEEPMQIEELANRPAWLAVIMEDGYYRHYRVDEKSLKVDEGGVTALEKSMLHVLDLGANYWSLWTEADNLRSFYERFPNGFDTLRRRMGYRVRPSWIWQRKRYGVPELIVAIANDGVAGVPGVLRLSVEGPDGKLKLSGCLDAGHPHGGRLRQASFLLPAGMDGEKVILRAQIETKGGLRRPVRWACRQPLNPDGSLTVQLKPHQDKDWRKGI